MATGKKGEKALFLGSRLKYPIRITKLYKAPGDKIRLQEPVLQYAYEYTMELPQDRATLQLQTKTLTSITDWNAPEDGKLLAWNVRVGDVVARDRACATVEEACTHEVQYQGLCGLCGKDMSEVNWASEQRGTDRAPINMTHDQTNLTVSRSAAARAETALQQRLLAQRKLSLVVDLDQTIIHACIDPTIGEWLQDPDNPNYAALRDVQRFQLEEGYHGAVARGCFYYIKMRPGLAAFLARIAALYEMHVYTMGTRTYATNIARIVDPDQRLFGNRVISRDENGNIVAKSLQRLFPVSTNMAVIIDDRADVWPYNRHNLIKVSPFDFFKGTGDINSSFLPRRTDLPPAGGAAAASDTVAAAGAAGTSPAASASSPTATATATATATPGTVVRDDHDVAASPASTAASTAVSPSPSDTTAPTSVTNGDSPPSVAAAAANGTPSPAPGGGDDADAALLQMQAEEQERAMEKQILDRPLLHMQEQLDRADEEAAAAEAENADMQDGGGSSSPSSSSPSSASQSRSRHCVLFDDDNELTYLEQHLTKLHRQFYDEYDAKRAAAMTAATAQKNETGGVDLAAVPDVGVILDRLKGAVLQGTTIVLSGLVPLGMSVERSELGLQALSFGAHLQTNVSKKVTHLVISSERPRTQKVRQAARFPNVKIVNQNWLLDCFSQWAHVDETPYLVNVHPADRGWLASVTGAEAEATDSETVSDADADSDTETGAAGPGLRVTVPSRDDGEDDEFTEFKNSDALSPIAELGTFDWGSADDELEMFLAEGDDDDDDDEEDDENEEESGGDEDGDDDNSHDVDMDRAGAQTLLAVPSKRKHGRRSGGGGGGGETDSESDRASLRGRSLLAKRQRRGGSAASQSRSTSRLRTAASASASGAQAAEATATAAPQPAAAASSKTAPANVEIDEDELEAMLREELGEDEIDNGAG